MKEPYVFCCDARYSLIGVLQRQKLGISQRQDRCQREEFRGGSSWKNLLGPWARSRGEGSGGEAIFDIQNFIPFWKIGGATKGPRKFLGDVAPRRTATGKNSIRIEDELL